MMARWIAELAGRLWIPLLMVACLHGAVTAARSWGVEQPVAAGAIMIAPGGSLRELAIQFHRPGSERFLEVYRQLFAAFDPDTTVHVIVGDSRDREIFEQARRGWGEGPHVTYAEVGRPITSWARDRLAVLDARPGGRITLLAPPAPMTGPETRANDWLAPWTLRTHLGAELTVARFQFEGGDLIADQEHVYVATPLFQRNPGWSPSSVVAAVEQQVSRPVIQLGDEAHPAPDHHVGMFVTPLGDGVVAWGDPDLGLALLGDAEVNVGGAPLPIDRDPASREPFRTVHRTLDAHGLETLALPLLVSTDPHAWISYGNVLMEHRQGQLHVYMPTYGLQILDQHAQTIYEARGAIVHPIRVDQIFRLGGTVRCLVAPLKRT